MQLDRDLRSPGQGSTADEVSESALSAHLEALARPLLHEALDASALVQTVREFPPEVPLEHLARAMAEDALRRGLRSSRADASADASAPLADRDGARAAAWQRATDRALADLAAYAARELERVRSASPVSRWHG